MNPHALTADEVAELLGVHINTVKRIPVNALPYFLISTRGDRRYRKIDLDAYLASIMARAGFGKGGHRE